MRIDGFVMMPAFSLGTAMTTFAGQNIGAGFMDRVEKGARNGTLTAMGISAVITALILLFGKGLMGVFTTTPELIDLSFRMMKILAPGYIAMEVTQCLSGTVNMDLYATGKALENEGVVSGLDITTEGALSKLFYLMGKSGDNEWVKARLGENLRGEISK